MLEMHQVKLTIDVDDPEMDPEEKDKHAQWLIGDLREIDEIETVGLVADPNPPAGSKAGGGFLAGLVVTYFSIDNLKKVLGFLQDRLSGKPIEIEIESNGKRLKLKVSSRQEFDHVMKVTQEFFKA